MFLVTVAGIGDHDVTEEGFIVIISSLKRELFASLKMMKTGGAGKARMGKN